jgi:CBS domain-containing protein
MPCTCLSCPWLLNRSLLLQKRIRRLPVVDDGGRLVGIISRSTIIKVALEQRKAASGGSE